MVSSTTIQNITHYFENHKSYVSRVKFLKDSYPEIFSQLPKDNVIENLYRYLHNISETPLCLTCNKPVKFNTFQTGFKEFCCHKCAVSNSQTTERRKKTNLQLYGVSNPLASSDIATKRRQTMIERFGVEHPLQNEELRSQVQKKNKSKSKEERLAIQEKRKNTCLGKYGVKNLWDLPEFVEKITQTNLKKYGSKWVQQNPEILGKRIDTRRKKFVEVLENRFENISPAFDVLQYTGINIYQGGSIYLWKCNKCGLLFEKIVKSSCDIKCPFCYPVLANFLSNGEQSIALFLDELGVSYAPHNRSLIPPYEVDFYLPEFNLGIEYCGLYWHSDKKVDKLYHSRKRNLCQEKGIRLITIFEDEWTDKKDICKSRLKNFLNRSKTLCGARKTTVKEISSNDYRKFMDTFHLQGYSPAKIKLGAYYQNELVSVMSFGRLRKALGHKSNNESAFEMIRYASAYNIPGIGSKLFRTFLRQYNPSQVLSYCDLRWGDGKFYEKIGFSFDSETLPNYWYSKDGIKKYHRYQFRKQELVKKGFSSSKTEQEIMEDLGYYRIYDCGNYKFLWENTHKSDSDSSL